MTPNQKAFLTMIAVSEGTAGIGDDGYNVMVGSRKSQALLFTSYEDHPRLEIRLRRDNPLTPQNDELVSSAAGRYQILSRFWDPLVKPAGLKSFAPQWQDEWALWTIVKERKAGPDIEAGNIVAAIAKCRNIWASLPGAGYGQHENRIEKLLAAYKAAGGTLI